MNGPLDPGIVVVIVSALVCTTVAVTALGHAAITAWRDYWIAHDDEEEGEDDEADDTAPLRDHLGRTHTLTAYGVIRDGVVVPLDPPADLTIRGGTFEGIALAVRSTEGEAP